MPVLLFAAGDAVEAVRTADRRGPTIAYTEAVVGVGARVGVDAVADAGGGAAAAVAEVDAAAAGAECTDSHSVEAERPHIHLAAPDLNCCASAPGLMAGESSAGGSPREDPSCSLVPGFWACLGAMQKPLADDCSGG